MIAATDDFFLGFSGNPDLNKFFLRDTFAEV
jgi:hypothetical protein